MKKPLTLLLLISCVCLIAAPGQLRDSITIEWEYPPEELSTNLTFYVYSSTNVSTPLTNWPRLATVTGTNLSVTVPMTAQARYFVMTSSNYWGQAAFSAVASTPPAPRSDVKLKLR